MADYAIHFKKANGELSPKVFKGVERTLASGDKCLIEINHSIKPITTRVYYPGLQKIEPRINGRGFSMKTFELII